MISVRKKSFILLTLFFISFFTSFSVVFFQEPVKASMALDLNEPTQTGTKIAVVAALVAYMGVRFAVQTSEVKSKVQEWVSSGKYALEQTTTGAIKVTNSLIYQLKQSASSLVAQGMATWDSGSGGSLVSGQTVDWNSSVASATDFSDVSNYVGVQEAVNAINQTNDKLDTLNNMLSNGLMYMVSNINGYTQNTNSLVNQLNSYVSQIPGILYGVQNYVNTCINSINYVVNVMGTLHNLQETTLNGIKDSVNTSIGEVKTSLDGVGASVNSINTSIGEVKTVLNTGFSDTVGSIGSMSGTIEGSLENVKTSVDAISQDFLGTNQDINLQPLKVAGDAFTTRFPFSLPWDLYHSFSSFSVDSVKPDFDIDMSKLPIASICGLDKISIDLSDYDELFALVKFFELLAFDIGLIFATRKLVGGDT